MATQIVISNNDSINIDDSFHISWVDKGNAMPALPVLFMLLFGMT